MLRLYDPLSGEIILDGLDLRTIRLESLRKRISVATQEPLLFDAQIQKNISYGLRDVNQADIVEAAKISCVHDFIVQLPQGYDSLVGENACVLSQGFKQRIALARALVRDPDLLILDEATSSIDLVTEEKIFSNLRKKRKGLSTIVISHRLSSVRDADRIYFLRDAEIEEGTHAQLLEKSPAYKNFFNNQIDLQINTTT